MSEMTKTTQDDVAMQRIIGTFIKQTWGGRRDNEAVYSSKVDFDATDAILLMPHSQLIALADHRENTDVIGQLYVAWDGPCEVELVYAIQDYFEVESLTDITPEMLEKAKQLAKPAAFVDETITLTIKIKATRAAGASLTEFIENLDYSIKSTTVGVVVANTEITDSEIKKPYVTQDAARADLISSGWIPTGDRLERSVGIFEVKVWPMEGGEWEVIVTRDEDVYDTPFETESFSEAAEEAKKQFEDCERLAKEPQYQREN